MAEAVLEPGIHEPSRLARHAERLAWIALGGLLVLFLCHQWFGPDIWYHLYLGQQIWATGSAQPASPLALQQPAYVNTYWLFQLAMRGLFAVGGIYAISAAFIAFWAGTLAAWLAASGLRRRAGAALATLAAILICQTRFEQRPEVLSYLFLALQIAWLAADRWSEPPRAPLWLGFVLVQVAWSNVHGYFLLGPLLVGLRLFAALLVPARGRTRRHLSLLLVLTLGASLASPFGWRNWAEVAVLARFFHAFHYSIQEFLPPMQVPGYMWGIQVFAGAWWVVLVGWIVVAVRAWRREAFALLLGALGLGLSLTAFRNLPLLVLGSGPLLAALGPLCAQVRLPRGVATGLSLTVLAVSGLLMAAVISNRYYRPTGGVPGFGLRESPYAYPVRLSGYLRDHPFAGLVFNDPGDGGYLEYHFPALRLYADSRFVEPAPIREYFSALARPAAFAALDEKEHFDAILLRVTESPYVLGHWLHEPGWALAYADLHRALLVHRRSPTGARAVLEPPHFYQGEDLAVPFNGASATAWAGILVLSENRAGLRLALQQWAHAPGVPSGVIQFAQEYGQGHADPEILALADRLRVKVLP